MENQDKQNQSQMLRKLGLFAVILGDLVGYTGAGIGIGYWAWSRWGAPWWILLMTSGFGLFWAFYKIYLLAQKE